MPDMNKRKKVAWHKHLKADKKLAAKRHAAEGVTTPSR